MIIGVVGIRSFHGRYVDIWWGEGGAGVWRAGGWVGGGGAEVDARAVR